MIDQDVPHDLRRDAEKLCPVLPNDWLATNESEVRFMNEGGRLQGVVGTLSSQVIAGEETQLVVNRLEKVIKLVLTFRSGRAEKLIYVSLDRHALTSALSTGASCHNPRNVSPQQEQCRQG
jgi:hypothetical protein